MDFLSAIPWDFSPDIIDFGLFKIRWYGILFALPFIVGYYLMLPIFREEGKKQEELETLTIYMIVSTIVGARLGHCLFYDPIQYLSHPLEILKVWEGGLASHGAALGIMAGMYLFARKRKGFTFLWVADRVVLVVAISGISIRLGNLFNSEIYGIATDLPWGFIFLNDGQTIARHPTQIYEALAYGFVFALLYGRYRKYKTKLQQGSQLAWFLILVFSARFLIEFVKIPQKGLDDGTLPLQMGQLLSIPLIALGVYLLLKHRRRQPAAMLNS